MTLRGRSYLVPLSIVLLAGAVGCGGAEPPPPPPPPPPVVSAEPPPAPASTPEVKAEAEKPALPDVAFGPTTASDAPKKMPKVTFKAPAPDQAIPAAKAADFEVKLNVKDWDVAPGGGHVHLILDNKPYHAMWDTKEAIKLSKLSDTIAEGEHLLVAFPSRHNHESVKGQGALATVHFWVGKKGAKAEYSPKAPMLIYSRPKGTYNASKADHVLVDWYLVNAELGDGKYSIKATAKGPGIDDGRTITMKTWTPAALDNLRNGTYTVSLELLDKDGKAPPGAWNSTSREITVNRDAPEDPSPAAIAEKKAEKKAEKAEKKAEKAEKKAEKAEKKADKAETKADKAEKKADTAEKKADKAEKKADTAEKKADTK
jgi:hypothetical protein